LPDLVVADVRVTPETPRPDAPFQVDATIQNAGDAAAGWSLVELRWNGQPVADRDVPPLEAGETWTVSYTRSGPRGNHTLDVVADRYANVGESREDNNLAGRAVAIAPDPVPADLQVDAILAPEDVQAGSTVQVHAVVTNTGWTAAGPFRVRLLVNGVRLGDATLPGLDGNASATLPFSWSPRYRGPYDLTVRADADAQVAESDELNNQLTRTVPVAGPDPPPPADLGVRILDVRRGSVATPALDAPGDPLTPRTLVIEVRNHGPGTGGGVLRVRETMQDVLLLGSWDFTIAFIDVAPLAPGEARLFQVEWEAARRIGDVRFVARIEDTVSDPVPENDMHAYDDHVLVSGAGVAVVY
jgi:subtilase family serine protease